MATLENRIGTNRFVALLGNPIPPAQRVAIDDHPGFTNSEFMLEGIKAEPFVVLSQVDAPSYSAARNLIVTYQQLTGSDAVSFVQGGVNSSSQGWLVKVIEVRQERCMALAAGAVGGLYSPSLGWCECRWVLQAIKI